MKNAKNLQQKLIYSTIAYNVKRNKKTILNRKCLDQDFYMMFEVLGLKATEEDYQYAAKTFPKNVVL